MQTPSLSPELTVAENDPARRSQYYTDASYSDAFRQARADQGKDGAFVWVNPKTNKAMVSGTKYMTEVPFGFLLDPNRANEYAQFKYSGGEHLNPTAYYNEVGRPKEATKIMQNDNADKVSKPETSGDVLDPDSIAARAAQQAVDSLASDTVENIKRRLQMNADLSRVDFTSLRIPSDTTIVDSTRTMNRGGGRIR